MCAKTSKPFSREEKRVAIELWRAKVPLKAIRDQVQMSESTLRRVLAFAKKNPDTLIAGRKVGSGRPCLINKTIQKTMKKKLLNSPTTTAKQLKKTVPGLANMSVRAIQHVSLKKLKLPSRVMAKKPLLTQKMKDQRLEFAHQYGHWSIEEWKQVMFSDESHFELRFGNQGSRCRRPVGSDRFEEKFTKKTVKHPPKVMAWGCFSWRGRGGLEFLEKGEMMNGGATGACWMRSWSFLCTSTERATFFKTGHHVTRPESSPSGLLNGHTSSSSSGQATLQILTP
jgi:hypothetical protein